MPAMEGRTAVRPQIARDLARSAVSRKPGTRTRRSWSPRGRRRGWGGEGVAAAAVVHQEAAASVEGDSPPFKEQRLDSLRPRLQADIPAARPHVDRQGEGRVEDAPVTDHQGDTPQHPVGGGGNVEKAGAARRPPPAPGGANA